MFRVLSYDMGSTAVKCRAPKEAADSMIMITERAAEKVKELMAAEGDPSLSALRVAVEGGGCSGFQYALGFDSAPEDNDEAWEHHGVRVVADPFRLPYLEGPSVDYSDGLPAAGFQTETPTVASPCGCG